MGARGVPPFPSPVPEGFHTPDQTVSIRGHESAAERVAMSIEESLLVLEKRVLDAFWTRDLKRGLDAEKYSAHTGMLR